jgi:flagellar biosynthesis GTPase FlhF
MPSLAELPDLTGFFSYSRRDDEHSQGSLSDLRRQIYNELRLQLGFDFKLWQDTEAIPEGTEWESEIQRAISDSVFFIPIVTPSSVASRHCRVEFQAFLDREEALGRKNLVFPLLYVRVPALEKEELWRHDPLLSIIGRRQYMDWQKFRHHSSTEAEVKRRIGRFCRNIVESLQQSWASPAERQAGEEPQTERVAKQNRRNQEQKHRQQTEAEAWPWVEQERRAAAEAEAQRVVEQARRDQEEKKRQQADVEAWQQAERQRRADEEAEAQLLFDQARRYQEEKKQQQAAYTKSRQKAEQGRGAAADEAEAQRLPDQERLRAATETDRSFASAVIFVLKAVGVITVFFFLVVLFAPR